MSGLSAGRVQSVATRLVVDRERERMAFRAGVVLGHRGHLRRRRASTSSGCSRPGCTPSTAPASPRGSNFGPDGQLKAVGQGRRAPRPQPRRGAGRGAARHDVRRCARSRPSPTAARPTRRSAPRPCSRRPAQARLSAPPRRCRWRSGSTRTASSPTCAPTPRRSPAPRSTPRASQVRELYGAEYLPDAPAHLRLQGQERPGGARGDPPLRRRVPHPGADRPDRRPVPALRADLDAHRRLADEGRRRPERQRAARRHGRQRRGRRVRRQRPGDHLPRLPQGLRRGPRRRQRADDAETRLPDVEEGDAVSAASLTADGPRDQAAVPLHRGHADQGARGARDRPALDVRLDHRHDPQPRLRLQEGHRAGAGVAGLLRGPAAGGALPAADLLRVHRPAWRTSSTRSPAAARTATPSWASSTSAPATWSGSRRWSTSSATSTPASWPPSRSAAPTPACTCGSAATAPTSRAPTTTATPAAKKANVPDDLPPDELTLEKATRAAGQPGRRGDATSATTPRPGSQVVAKNGRYGPYVTEVLPEDAPKSAKPAHRLAVQVDGPGHRHPRRRAQAAEPAARGRRGRRVRRGDHRAERPLRAVPEEGHRLPLDHLRGAAASRSPSTRRCAIYAQPKQRGRAPRRRRSRSSATTRSPGSRSWSRRAGSASTSPTASTTPPCARTTRSRRSPSSGPPSCWPSAASKGPAKKAAKKGAKKTRGQEDHRQEEPPRRRRRPRKKAAAKKA